MPEKFNGTWKIRKGRVLGGETNFVTDDVNITVASYNNLSFTFPMKIGTTDVAFPATDVTDRFTIAYTTGGVTYEADVWRIDLFYPDNIVGKFLTGVIKRSLSSSGQDSCVTEPDTVSFTAIKMD